MKKTNGIRSHLSEVQRCIMRSSRLDNLKMDVKQLVIDRDIWKSLAIAYRIIIRDAHLINYDGDVEEILEKANKLDKEFKRTNTNTRPDRGMEER